MQRSKATNGDDPYEYLSDDETAVEPPRTRAHSEPVTNGNDTTQAVETMDVDEPVGTISEPRLTAFKSNLQKVFRSSRSQSLSLDNIKKNINEDQAEAFAAGEITAALRKMEEDNQIMISDGIVFLI